MNFENLLLSIRNIAKKRQQRTNLENQLKILKTILDEDELK